MAHYKGNREKYEQIDIMDAIQSYRTSRRNQVVNPSASGSSTPQPTGIAKVMAGLAEIGMTGIKPEDLPKLLSSDSMEPALMIMAEVRAYFQGNWLINYIF